MKPTTISTEKQLIKMSKLYQNFKINPSKVTGTFKLNEQYGLNVDGNKDPKEWKVFDGLSGDFISCDNLSGNSAKEAESFIEEWNGIFGETQADPLDNLKAGGFKIDGEPQESTVEAPSVESPNDVEIVEPESADDAELKAQADREARDENMRILAEAEERKMIEMEQREKNKASAPTPNKNEWKAGGYKAKATTPSYEESDNIQDVVYEAIGDQKKVALPKPGRRIKNLVSELMEVGTIRAGEKTISSNGKVIPKKTEYFIVTTKTRKNAKDKNEPDLGYEVDEEIHAIVGKEPTKLKVRLPCDREDLNFVTYFGKYKSAVCECRGDNFSAETSTGDIIECHGVECESFIKGECKKHGVLSVILEEAPRSGVIWKFRTTSRSSISYLDASLALLTGIANGHVASLPLWFTLTPKETTIPNGPQKGKRTTVYVANLEFRGGYKELESTVRNLIAERNGRDTVSSIERVMEAALSLPDSPEESQDIQETFHPDEY